MLDDSADGLHGDPARAGLTAAAVLHLIGHGFYKAWLFLRAGGAVSRHRWHAAPGMRRPARPFRHAVGWGALAGAVAVVLAAPAVAHSIRGLGAAAAAPPLLAVSTAAFAAVVAARASTTSRQVAACVALAGAVLAAAYAWALAGWEHLLAPSLPLARVWTTGAALALVGVLAAGAVILVVATATVVNHPDGRLAVRLSRTALAPWARRHRGPAAWPATNEPGVRLTPEEAAAHVEVAAEVVAPAWPLRTIVAANPLSGLEGLDFGDAAEAAGRAFGTRGHLAATEFARLYDAGRITRTDLRIAVRMRTADRGEHLDAAMLEAAVDRDGRLGTPGDGR